MTNTAHPPMSPRMELANAMVGVYSQFYGRGPTKARAHVSEDLVVVVLEGVLTRSEQTLRDRGETEEVDRSRRAFQRVVREEFVGAVERITGREVRSFMSEMDAEHDVAVEIFVLEPVDHATNNGSSAPLTSCE
jgi:uncharacterized protein YbcI